MPSRCCEFVDSRLCRSPPDRASAVTYGQAGENVMRFPHLAHRSAAAHKLHSTPQQHGMNLISGNGETKSRLPTFSLFLPGSCPNNRDHRKPSLTTARLDVALERIRAQETVVFLDCCYAEAVLNGSKFFSRLDGLNAKLYLCSSRANQRTWED